MGTNDKLQKLFAEAVAIEAESAKEAGALSYMARSMVMATLPHRKVEGNEFIRQNGDFTLSLMSPTHIGLPFGSIPRLLVAWVTTEAVRTKQRELILGDSLSEFMRALDLVPTGGRWGTITRLKEQMARLFASSVTCSYADGKRFAFQSVQVVDRASLWWDPKTPEQSTLWQSAIVLGEHFFKEIIESPVAVDMRALKVLKQSPMALDIYTLLTYRMSYLRKSTAIPWDGMQQQLGSDYAQTPEGLRNFKKKFIKALSMVHVVYPDANIDVTETGLILKPSKTHVPMLIK
ncbi:replication protein RepA [Chlorobium sp. N1]|uniref:replication protein RepA n=1 Tax=Chlorobium sp. N1 TaxID=2491138 RepID=UPI00103FD5AB|nr:replication protein RepA [Chlorobium sp. N1]TCD46935.1 pirin [Chlorobium sp. N1]